MPKVSEIHTVSLGQKYTPHSKSQTPSRPASTKHFMSNLPSRTKGCLSNRTMASCKSTGLLNFFEKKPRSQTDSSPPHTADISPPTVAAVQLGVQALPAQDALHAASVTGSETIGTTRHSEPDKKNIFALFQPKQLAAVDVPAVAEKETLPVDANEVEVRRNPRRGPSEQPAASVPAKIAGIFLSAGKRNGVERGASGTVAPQPRPAPTRDIIDVEKVASIFHTESMREAKKKKEQESFLQSEKKKSRETEMAFFKSEKSAGRSLNALLMQSSAATSSAGSRSNGGDDDSAIAVGPRIEFAEIVHFPKWQHVAMEHLRVDATTALMCTPLGCVARPLLPRSHLVSRSTVDLTLLEVDLCHSPDVIATTHSIRGSLPCCVDSPEPLTLDAFTLRSMWLQYMLQQAAQRSAATQVIDISIDSSSVIESAEGSTGAVKRLNLVDAFSPRSSKDICGNKKQSRQLKRWLNEWVKIHDERKRRQVARELKRQSDALSKSKRGTAGAGTRGRKPAVSKPPVKGILGLSSKASAKADPDDDEEWKEDNDASDFSQSDIDDSVDVMAKVFILQGPTGCGKNCMVAACAMELGFDVKEENTTNSRTGSLLKKRVLETSQSKGMTTASSSGALATFATVGDASPSQRSGSPSSAVHGMKLILFDEADICFDDDAGFYRAIVDLAKDSKCPIVIITQTDLLSGDGRAIFASMKPPPEVAILALPTHAEATEYVAKIARGLEATGALNRWAYDSSGLQADVAALTAVCGCDIRACLATLQVLIDRPHLGAPCTVQTGSNDNNELGSSRIMKFHDWLLCSGLDQRTLCDTFSDAFQFEESGDPLGASHSNMAAMGVCQYVAPVIIAVKPALINPYNSCVLHVEGRNFLQQENRKSAQTNHDGSEIVLASVYVWLCGRRFTAQLHSDELLVVHLPSLLDTNSPPSDWFYFGSQNVTVQVGNSASSDQLGYTREFFRYMASDVPACVPFMSSISCDTYCCSHLAFVIIIDPYDMRNKNAQSDRMAILQRKKQRRSDGMPGLLLCISRKTGCSLVSIDSVSVAGITTTYTSDDAKLPEIAPTVAPAPSTKKRCRKNVISDNEDEDNEPMLHPESHDVDLGNGDVIIGELFDDDDNVSKSARSNKSLALHRDAVCSILDECLRDPEIIPFVEPVDMLLYPDYYMVIKRPMDLGTIRETLMEGAYDIPDTRRRDVGLLKLRRRASASFTSDDAYGDDMTVDFESFVKDVRLVWSNCLEYNQPESELAAMSEKMSILFELILERESQRLRQLFSWEYRAPPARRGRKKRSASKLNAGSANPIIRSFENGSRLVDEGTDEEELETAASRLSATADSLTLEMPILNLPSHEELCSALNAVELNRLDREKKLNETLNSVDYRKSYDMKLGVSATSSRYIEAEPASNSTSTIEDLVRLAELSAARSDAELLMGIFDFHAPMVNPFCTSNFGFADGAAMSPMNCEALDVNKNSGRPEDIPVSSGGLAGFFGSAPNSANGTSFRCASDESLAAVESLWSDSSFQLKFISRFGFPLKTSNSTNSFITPFSGIAWRGCWRSIYAIAVSITEISGTIYTACTGATKRKVFTERNIEGNKPFDNYTPLSIYWRHREMSFFLSGSSSYWEAVSKYNGCGVFYSNTSQYQFRRDFILEGLPILRAMLRAEAELTEDGKSFTGICRYSPDGEDMCSQALILDSAMRTSTRLSLNRNQINKYQYINKLNSSSNCSEEFLNYIAAFGRLKFDD